ncbi:unnamed protein product [Dimorphilus gyrociliatus]|uniref:Uncharacterized protein n=1 Tax=Dimorphilus gyrociliatus TaxID=2664684 RepID=A0A7I8W1X0_9ANNE|nr:unnamed protein product [Dimorphilus gyrociliatus]
MIFSIIETSTFVTCVLFSSVLCAPLWKDACLQLDPPNLQDTLAEYRVQYDVQPTSMNSYFSKSFGDYLVNENENVTCPKSLTDLQIELDKKKITTKPSTCPTYSVISYNEDRYPRSIKESLCRCTQTENNGCLTRTSQTDLEFECEAIYAEIVVLYKERGTCEGEFSKYVPALYKQQVGCGCVHKTIYA